MPYPYQTAEFKREESTQIKTESQNNNTQAQSTKDLLTITIEIGNGRNENIYINEGDSPRQLAVEFAHRHGIND